MSKKVYILGAGFSYPAKMPIQKGLLKAILDYEPTISDDNAIELYKHKRELKNFLSIFGNKDYENIDIIEDLFTILDRAYLFEENFQRYKWQELYGIRKGLVELIISTIDKYQQGALSNSSSYKSFVEYLSQSIEEGNDTSLLVLNWDTLFENIFLRETSGIYIDYCFYTYGLKGKAHIPHIHLKPSGKKNLKVLKLHGSINWLECTNCGRIYVDSDINIAKVKTRCEFCNLDEDKTYDLNPIIITPTLLKQLNNLHIKSTWNNAFIELQEAEEIVFIGYSLPKADFELMYLLKKSLYYYNKIQVVLAPSDKGSLVHRRYQDLFGDKVEFHFEGFEKWVKKSCV